MRIQAQVDKVIQTAGETIRMCISSEDQSIVTELSDVREALDFVTNLFDDRLYYLNTCLIEDGHFLNYMNDEEKIKFQTAFNALYLPTQTGASIPLNIKENIKFQLGKNTAEGEAITLELSEFGKYEDVKGLLKDALTYLDMRTESENKKSLLYEEIFKSFPYDTQLLLGKAFDALFGRITPDRAKEILKGHIEQAKEREENNVQV